ncbi:MAG TPA: polyprenyl synthetase family protein [Saprospiraceae bacterium]|nr:polyprenyl synthetase family protein [Saprospiraceae bacterium]
MQSVSALKNLFDDFVESQKFRDEPKGLFEPMNYILELGGKRLRPVIALMSYNIFSDEVEKALPMAFSLELFHNFTLAHDDIMDYADLRRGKPTMHIRYSINTGILSGDAMMMYAFHYLNLSSEDDQVQRKLNSLFTKTAIEVCVGQQMDMDFETLDQVELEKYLQMIKYKTAVLLAGCFQTGAILGKATDTDAEALYAFGINLGLAFQIQDDLLDLYSDERFGKIRGGDILQSKKTYLYLTALQQADQATRDKLLVLYKTKTLTDHQKVEQVESIFNQLNVRELAEKAVTEYTDASFIQLDSLSVERKRLEIIRSLAEELIQRKY